MHPPIRMRVIILLMVAAVDALRLGRAAARALLSAQLCLNFGGLSLAASEPPQPSAVPAVAALEPSDTDNNLARAAFKDFDEKRLDAAEREFSMAIARWGELHRPRDEVVSLLKARANVLVDSKKFPDAVRDYDEALRLMSPDGEKPDGTGTAAYPEYPDTFAGRALAFEGLGQWDSALSDYNKAISLWGGGRGEGINPYVLTFRGNTLSKLGRYDESIEDYRAAADIFLAQRDIGRYSDAKANLALALYAADRRDESLKAMKDVIRRDSGYADMHVAIAADSWDTGDYIKALKEWQFTCDEISVGCDKYKDLQWVSVVRRWPPNLVAKLDAFLARKVPEKMLEGSESLKRM